MGWTSLSRKKEYKRARANREAAPASDPACGVTDMLLILLQAVQEDTLEALYHANCQQQQPPQQAQQGSSTAAACSTSPQSHMHDAGGHSSSGRRRSKSATTSSSGSSSACVLVEKLYKHKLRSLLQQGHTTLLCCSVCGELFASASHSKLQCAAAAGSTHTPSNR